MTIRSDELFDPSFGAERLSELRSEGDSWREARERDASRLSEWSEAAASSSSPLGLHAVPSSMETSRGGFAVFDALFRRGEFDAALDFSAELSRSFPELADSPSLAEKRIVCMNKATPPRIEEAIAAAEALAAAAPHSGEAAGALGKAHRVRAAAAAAAGDPEQAALSQRQSMEAYLRGFLSSGEFYPGINAAYALESSGDFSQAQAVAKWTGKSALSVWDNHDYWSCASAMEAAVLSGDAEALDLASRKMVAHRESPDWMFDATINSLLGLSPDRFPLAGPALEALSSRLGSFEPDPAPRHPILEKTFSYRNMGSDFAGGEFISGNLAFGGQLPAHAVSRWDRRQFRQLLDAPLADWLPADVAAEASRLAGADRLSASKDPKAVLASLDAIIRNSFDTDGRASRESLLSGARADSDGLERLDSDEHKAFDASVRSLNESFLAGRPREADSRTNVALCFAMGIGDCRHHAQAKQMLFDLWQDHRLSEIAALGVQAALRNDQASEDILEREYDSLSRILLRTAHVEVFSQAQGQGLYDIERGASGLPLQGQEIRHIESHSMSFLVRVDAAGHPVSARLADSFYQKEYPFGDGELDLSSGKFDFSAGNIRLEAPDGSLVSSEVRIAPSPFAGKCSKQSPDETGANPLFMGIEAQSSSVLSLMASRKDQNRIVERNILFAASPSLDLSDGVSLSLDVLPNAHKSDSAPELISDIRSDKFLSRLSAQRSAVGDPSPEPALASPKR